jgi:post-segregation antitoxin (ccd killing protein)
VKRSIDSDIVEQWMTHMRLQRTRARDMVWLIERGATHHDGREGEPMNDATQRWLAEQKEVIAEVDRLITLYENANGMDNANVMAEQL